MNWSPDQVLLHQAFYGLVWVHLENHESSYYYIGAMDRHGLVMMLVTIIQGELPVIIPISVAIAPGTSPMLPLTPPTPPTNPCAPGVGVPVGDDAPNGFVSFSW